MLRGVDGGCQQTGADERALNGGSLPTTHSGRREACDGLASGNNLAETLLAEGEALTRDCFVTSLLAMTESANRASLISCYWRVP
jgi:hypothetical protein